MDNLNFQKAFDTVPYNRLPKPKTAGILDETLGKKRLAREQNKKLRMKQNGKQIEDGVTFQEQGRKYGCCNYDRDIGWYTGWKTEDMEKCWTVI